ncbi:MAG: hypothetical protein JWM85_2623 [Acidimicrobiaceae bacterium]|nr:hypothetical protein [Acidimicrobiaceae bacterium]
MFRANRRRVRPDGRGGFELHLPAPERELLASLPAQLDELLSSLEDRPADDAAVPDSLRRLLPPAYPRDDEQERAYVDLARSELLEHHRSALQLLESTASASNLSAEELESWMAALNELRLVIGTTLGVSEDQGEIDEDDPDYSQWVCYSYLSFLQSEVVDALSGLLPPPLPGADDEVPDDPWGEPLGGLRWDGTPVPEGP